MADDNLKGKNIVKNGRQPSIIEGAKRKNGLGEDRQEVLIDLLQRE